MLNLVLKRHFFRMYTMYLQITQLYELFESDTEQDWKALSLHPAVYGYLIIIGEGSGEKNERIQHRLLHAKTKRHTGVL